MRESEKQPVFDDWQVVDANHITLESPMSAIGAGHLEVYLEDPENAFEGEGIAIKTTLPEAVMLAFFESARRGEKLFVDVVAQGTQHRFVLTHRLDNKRYPWRLVKE